MTSKPVAGLKSSSKQSSGFIVRHLGLEAYETTWAAMQAFTRDRDQHTQDELWAVQHFPVFTQGQAGKPEHILDAHQVPVVKTDRGGQVTYHGPGQLVIYILCDVKRKQLGVRNLVDAIEHSIISLLADLGIQGKTLPRAPGVYVDDRKIAALGLRIRKGCSYHGLSLNIDMDMTPFSWINPCGYEGLESIQLRDLIAEPSAQLFAETEQNLIRVLTQNLL